MEIDLYKDEVDRKSSRLYENPKNVKYYKIKKNKNVIILDINKILIDNISRLYNLKLKYSEDFNELPIKIQKVIISYLNKQKLKPIYVKEKIIITDKMSHFGLSVPGINKFPTIDNYFYEIIEGHEYLFLSKMYNFKYVPVIIK